METLDRVLLALLVALMVAVSSIQAYKLGQASERNVFRVAYADVKQELGDCYQRYYSTEGGQE